MLEREESIKRVVVIDDDDRMQAAVQDFLRANGYEVNSLKSGRAVQEGLDLYKPDIILLDILMPGEDGLSVLQRIRTMSSVPVIMVTAKGEDMDRVIGLELGADDYLPKPFLPRELLARIKAVLRRSSGRESVADDGPQAIPQHSSPFSPEGPDTINSPPYVLDTRRQSLGRGKKRTALSTAEFCLLHALMSNPGTVLSREQLQVLAFGRGDYAGPRNIDVHISRIRGMLARLGEENTRIRTVWGQGYCWVREE